jgi:uncharacterized protein (TIGR03118 family)
VTAIACFLATFACGSAADPTASASAADMVPSMPSTPCTPSTPTFPQLLVETPIVTTADDPNLINAWGLSFAPSGFAWVSDNGTGLASVYPSTGAPAKLVVTIPAPPGAMGPSAPTGNVPNTDTSQFKGDKFIFATEDGTIAGWQDGTQAALRVDNSKNHAVYKGLSIHFDTKARKTRLYATNFFAATVDVFNGRYEPVKVKGGFVDDQIPSGFAPFNVLSSPLGVLVTYAKQDDAKHDDVKGPGNGFVDLFDFDGKLVARLISRGPLNSPWGLAFAPDQFGNISDALLVGNFGDGLINVFAIKNTMNDKNVSCGNNPPVTADFLGSLGDADTDGNPVRIDGLWALQFGPDAGGFSSHTLYFTGGPVKETLGVFGMLTLPMPPSSGSN